MEYNTTREPLIISEYGRYIQKLVEHCMTIKDDDKRNRTAKTIIELMIQLNPQVRNLDEFRQKLWDHIIIISGYKLKVESPFPYPKPEAAKKKTSAACLSEEEPEVPALRYQRGK